MAEGGFITFSQFSDETIYGVPQLDQLMNWIVTEIPAEWEGVGIQLKIPSDQLEAIKVNTSCGGDPKKMLCEVMKLWERDPQPGAPYNWETILNVLITPAVNRRELAQEVADKIKNKLQKQESKSEQCQDTIVPALPDTATSIGYYTDGDLKKLCGCGECSLEDIITRGCSRSDAMSQFPILDVTRLPPCKSQQYLYMLRKDTNEINDKFANLSGDICCSLIKRNIHVKAVVNFLLVSRRLDIATVANGLPLENSQDMYDVFTVLAKITSWFNHHPLGSLVNRYGSEDDKEAYRKFTDTTLMRYLRRTVTEIPKDAFGPEIEGSGEFKLKLGDATNISNDINISGNDVLYIKDRVAEILNIPFDSFTLRAITKGCLELVFNLPYAIYEKLFFPLSHKYAQALADIVIDTQDTSVHLISIWYDGTYYDLPFKKSISFDDSDVTVNGEEFTNNDVSISTATTKTTSPLSIIKVITCLPEIAKIFQIIVEKIKSIFHELVNGLAELEANQNSKKEHKEVAAFYKKLNATEEAISCYLKKVLSIFKKIEENSELLIHHIEQGVSEKLHIFNKELKEILEETESLYEDLEEKIKSLIKSCKGIQGREDVKTSIVWNWLSELIGLEKSKKTFKSVTQVFATLHEDMFIGIQDILSKNAIEQELTKEEVIVTLNKGLQDTIEYYTKIECDFRIIIGFFV